MNVYLVRHLPEANEKSAEAVGIFAVHSLPELRDLVDQVTDPNICEYAAMPSGGVVFGNKAPAIPFWREDETDGEYRHLLDSADLDERWMEPVCGGVGLNWKSLVPNKNGWLPGVGLLPDHVKGDIPLVDQLI